MKKSLTLLITIFIFAMLLGACDKPQKEAAAFPPEIEVTADGHELYCASQSTVLNGEKLEQANLFKEILSNSVIKIAHIALLKQIEVVFSDAAPDSCQLQDCLLREDGSLKYDSKLIQDVPIELEDGAASFTLERNPAVFLSSNLEDYEPGATIRGFKLTCTFGEDQCEYVFVVRTDG